MFYYKNTEQMSELTNYEFKLPKFGKTTTDPTYYEPAATRIANMRKSAQSGKNLQDFDGSDLPKDKDGNIDWSKQDISKARITPGRKPGLTKEEISQHLTDTTDEYNSIQEDKAAEKANTEKDISKAKATLEAISNNSEKSSE